MAPLWRDLQKDELALAEKSTLAQGNSWISK